MFIWLVSWLIGLVALVGRLFVWFVGWLPVCLFGCCLRVGVGVVLWASVVVCMFVCLITGLVENTHVCVYVCFMICVFVCLIVC